MALIERAVLIGPSILPPSGSQKRGLAVTQYDGLVAPALRQAERGEVAVPAVPGAGGEEAAMLHRASGFQLLATGAFENIVPGVVAEAAHRHGASDRLGLGRDDRRDLALLERPAYTLT